METSKYFKEEQPENIFDKVVTSFVTNFDKSNLINLTAREHYIAHLLLRKIYPNVFGLNIAIEIMRTYS